MTRTLLAAFAATVIPFAALADHATEEVCGTHHICEGTELGTTEAEVTEGLEAANCHVQRWLSATGANVALCYLRDSSEVMTFIISPSTGKVLGLYGDHD